MSNSGRDDKAQGKGQKDPNQFTSDAARKQYQADWHKEKERQEQQQKKK